MTGSMMKKEKINLICEYLDTLFSDPKCELNYSKDYELLIAVMLSAQTTDKRVNEVTKIIFEKYPTLAELKDAKLEDITSIIRPLGTYQRKASYLLEIANILYYQYDGVVPNDRDKLEAMPGVGRKVANVVLSEWFKEPSIAVDTHVDRVSKRLRLAKENANVLEVEHSLQKKIPKDKWVRAHHQLVLFGRYYCKAVKPSCVNCKLTNICKYKEKTR